MTQENAPILLADTLAGIRQKCLQSADGRDKATVPPYAGLFWLAMMTTRHVDEGCYELACDLTAADTRGERFKLHTLDAIRECMRAFPKKYVANEHEFVGQSDADQIGGDVVTNTGMGIDASGQIATAFSVLGLILFEQRLSIQQNPIFQGSMSQWLKEQIDALKISETAIDLDLDENTIGSQRFDLATPLAITSPAYMDQHGVAHDLLDLAVEMNSVEKIPAIAISLIANAPDQPYIRDRVRRLMGLQGLRSHDIAINHFTTMQRVADPETQQREYAGAHLEAMAKALPLLLLAGGTITPAMWGNRRFASNDLTDHVELNTISLGVCAATNLLEDEKLEVLHTLASLNHDIVGPAKWASAPTSSHASVPFVAAPLDIAASFSDSRVVLMLLEAGASPLAQIGDPRSKESRPIIEGGGPAFDVMRAFLGSRTAMDAIHSMHLETFMPITRRRPQ